MKKRAAIDGGGDRPSLTLTHPVMGTLIIMDLDRMGELVEEAGLSEYKPNRITGLLTSLVESFASKWSAVVVYGLDRRRGTEEAIIEIPLVEPWEVLDDLEYIRKEVENAGGSITIIAVHTWITGAPARNRREAYTGYRRRALRLLKKLKRKGGNTIYIDSGDVSPPSGD
ncbi:MAG: hypothetical protein GSR86_01645 [Desulfurococcales archaeon]|nr:hypothetical protein [Desulfurococcales archaeon]